MAEGHGEWGGPEEAEKCEAAEPTLEAFLIQVRHWVWAFSEGNGEPSKGFKQGNPRSEMNSEMLFLGAVGTEVGEKIVLRSTGQFGGFCRI